MKLLWKTGILFFGLFIFTALVKPALLLAKIDPGDTSTNTACTSAGGQCYSGPTDKYTVPYPTGEPECAVASGDIAVSALHCYTASTNPPTQGGSTQPSSTNNSGGYVECELGNPTGCNPLNGVPTTGQVIRVSNGSCQYSGYGGYPNQSAEPACVQRVCSGSINTYNECGDTTGGPCNNNGRQELITVSHCNATGQYYCWNQGPQPGCGKPDNPPSSSPPVTTPPSKPIASISLVVGFPGIGFNAVGGIAPKHLTRPVTVELYDAKVTNPSGPGTTPLSTGTGTVTYDATTDNNAGYFVGTIANITLPSAPPADNQYKILVKIPQYLYTLAVNTDGTQVFTITSGATVTSQQFTMYAGDVATTGGGQNKLNLDDWNVITACYGDHANTSQCPVKPADSLAIHPADLDDDGAVEIVDLNIWLRSVYQLQQLQPSPCSGDTCSGF